VKKPANILREMQRTYLFFLLPQEGDLLKKGLSLDITFSPEQFSALVSQSFWVAIMKHHRLDNI
jgi:hypothetical protein